MTDFSTKCLPDTPDAIARTGRRSVFYWNSQGVEWLILNLRREKHQLRLPTGPLKKSGFLRRSWRNVAEAGSKRRISPGAFWLCITIPVGTHFQFRAFGHEPLAAVGVTMPPWPGECEAYVVEGKWEATVPRKSR